MAANWPTCTAVQVPLSAYAAKMAGWLFASPPVWNWVTTMYRSCPPSSSVADRRSDVRSIMAPPWQGLGLLFRLLGRGQYVGHAAVVPRREHLGRLATVPTLRRA